MRRFNGRHGRIVLVSTASLAALLLLIAIVLLWSGCGGSGSTLLPTSAEQNAIAEPAPNLAYEPDDAGDDQLPPGVLSVVMRPQEPEEQGPKGVSLAAPGTFGQLLPDPAKLPSYQVEDLQVAGSAYYTELPYNRVAPAQDSVVFVPGCGDESFTFDKPAYCVYRFYLAGYDLNATLGLTWEGALEAEPEDEPDYSQLWTGIANFTANRWDWYCGPDDGVLTVESYEPYIDPVNGYAYFTIVVTGIDSWMLNQVTVGQAELRGTGSIEDDDVLTGLPLFSGGGTLPGYIDLTDPFAFDPVRISPIRDQKTWNSCTAFAIADGAFNYEMMRLYFDYGWDFSDPQLALSPKFLYVESEYTQVEEGDVGRRVNRVGEYFIELGTATEPTAPYDLNYSHHFIPAAFAEAGLLKPSGWVNLTIDLEQPVETLVSLKTVLAVQQRPIVLRIRLDQRFASYLAGEIWAYQEEHAYGTPFSHAMMIVGYSDSRQAFKVKNSWGTEWGEDGYCWIAYESIVDPLTSAACWLLYAEFDEAVVRYFFDPGGIGEIMIPPQQINATKGSRTDGVMLNWQAATGATGYHIYRDAVEEPLVTTGAVLSWLDDTLEAEDYNSHYYTLRSFNDEDVTSIHSTPVVGYKGAEPQVAFTPQDPVGNAQLIVDFDASTSSDPDGGYLSFSWDFDNDGTLEVEDDTAPLAAYTYNSAGEYTAVMTARDDEGMEQSAQTTVYVGGLPFALLDADQTSGDPPLVVNFDASTSFDPDDYGTAPEIVKYEWDLDGNPATGVEGFEQDTGITSTAQYTYNKAGIIDARVRVTDNEGGSDIESITIQINGTPVASLDASPLSGDLPLGVAFDASASYDPAGDDLYFDWDWNYDDPDPEPWELLNGGPTPYHIFNEAGIHTVRVRARDDDGEEDFDTIQIEVNDPPVAVLSADPTAGQAPLEVEFDADDSYDNDGGIVQYDYDWNDDGAYDLVDGSPIPTHEYESYGDYTCRLRVHDDFGSTTTTTIDIDVNGAPTVTLDADPTAGGAPLTVDFDASADDPDGSVVDYEWDFDGDGNYNETDNDEDDYQGDDEAQCTYDTDGSYPATVRVTDNDGGVATDSQMIDVSPGWEHTWGSTGSELFNDTCFDSSLNMYYAGQTNSYGYGNYDVLLTKYDYSGTWQWSHTWGTTSPEYIEFIEATTADELLLVGRTHLYGTEDLLVMKYDTEGDVQWVKSWGHASSHERPVQTMLLDSGNLLIMGMTNSGDGFGNWDIFIVEYDTSGNLVCQYNYGTAGEDIPYDICTNSVGNYYIGLYQEIGSTDYPTYVKLDSNLGVVSACQFAGYANNYMQAIAVDDQDNLYCFCHLNNYGLADDIDIVKFDSAGVWQWTKCRGGNGDLIYDLNYEDDGYFYFCGFTDDTGGNGNDAYIGKIDTNGNFVWAKTYGWIDSELWKNYARNSNGVFSLAGYDDEVDGLWEDYTVTENGEPSHTISSATCLQDTLTFSENTPTGDVTNPTTGVHDTGGGNYDGSAIKAAF